MTGEQVEKVARFLYDIDGLRGVRSQRWSVGAAKKRELYRAKARAPLNEQGDRIWLKQAVFISNSARNG